MERKDLHTDGAESPKRICPEAREVMDRIPSAVIRWGMTVMTVIVAGMLAAACFIRWPVIVECPCNVQMPTADTCCVTVQLPPKVIEYITRGNITKFSVQSPLLNDVITIHANVGLADLHYEEEHTFTVKTAWPKHLPFPDCGMNQFNGKAVFIFSHRRLIFHLFPFLESQNESLHGLARKRICLQSLYICNIGILKLKKI